MKIIGAAASVCVSLLITLPSSALNSHACNILTFPLDLNATHVLMYDKSKSQLTGCMMAITYNKAEQTVSLGKGNKNCKVTNILPGTSKYGDKYFQLKNAFNFTTGTEYRVVWIVNDKTNIHVDNANMLNPVIQMALPAPPENPGLTVCLFANYPPTGAASPR